LTGAGKVEISCTPFGNTRGFVRNTENGGMAIIVYIGEKKQNGRNVAGST
jgi:hypothetical protein